MIVLPAPLMVRLLMIVCSGPVQQERLAAGVGPGLRGADGNRDADGDAFVGLDAAAGDRQRAAAAVAKRVAGAAAAYGQPVGDNRVEDGDVSVAGRSSRRWPGSLG